MDSIPIVSFRQQLPPIAVCCLCDTPLPNREGVTVTSRDHVEDYCSDCFDQTLLLTPRR